MGSAAFILSFIKAIPAIRDIFLKTMELYYASVDAADYDSVTRSAKKRDSVIAALKLPGLKDEERNNLRRVLYDLSGH